MKRNSILVINPGSTSTKIAVYEFNKFVFLKSIRHTKEELMQFDKISDQYGFRKELIMHELNTTDVKIDKIVAVVGRGGLLKPIESGTYEVNDKMIEDLQSGLNGQHASNLGGLIAYDLAKHLPHAKAYIADPVVVDELDDVARISGHPNFERKSIFHALNQKAVAREHAKSIGKKYEDVNFIVTHMGGGITVGAHRKGRVIDVNNGLDGEGPFSPERAGTCPAGQLARLCYSEKHTLNDVLKMITGKGGLFAYLGTNDAYEVEQRAEEGDKKAALLRDALAYQVGKEIGAMATALNGEVDAIILTGGIAYDDTIVEYIKKMISFIAPVVVYPGQDEMKALALSVLRVLNGEAELMLYS